MKHFLTYMQKNTHVHCQTNTYKPTCNTPYINTPHTYIHVCIYTQTCITFPHSCIQTHTNEDPSRVWTYCIKKAFRVLQLKIIVPANLEVDYRRDINEKVCFKTSKYKYSKIE